MECVNLKERFGKRYRIRYEESYQADRGNKAWGDDPWLQIIPCRHGHIYPHGDNLLGASTDKRGAIARKLAALPETTIYQDGDDGLTVLFDAADFGKIGQGFGQKSGDHCDTPLPQTAGRLLPTVNILATPRNAEKSQIVGIPY